MSGVSKIIGKICWIDGTVSNQTEERFLIQKEHDKRKREYANLHKIKLLEIWYWDYKNIYAILTDVLLSI